MEEGQTKAAEALLLVLVPAASHSPFSSRFHPLALALDPKIAKKSRVEVVLKVAKVEVQVSVHAALPSAV